MQVHRLFEIVYILLHKKQATADELAKRFEVSRRTVYRDVDALSQAGIPVYTAKGKGGGIRLMDGFVLNRSMLSQRERQDLLSALQGLRATSYPDVDPMLSKLSALFGEERESWITVDFSDWSNRRKEQFETIKTAVLEKRVLRFTYFSSYGQRTHRETEPLQLCFKDRSWYLRAYCREKEGIRLFKLLRLQDVELTGESFERSVPPEDPPEPPDPLRDAILLKLWIDGSQAYRVFDEFFEEQITRNPDGSFTVTVEYHEDEWVYGSILSYGRCIKVLEPPHICRIIRQRAEEIAALYGADREEEGEADGG